MTTSYAWSQGLCAVFDGEGGCDRQRGHEGAHRFHDPSGSGRWVEKDDFGVEVARGGRGWRDAEAAPAATPWYELPWCVTCGGPATGGDHDHHDTYTLATLDRLHARVGLGEFWQDSDARADVVRQLAKATLGRATCGVESPALAFHPDHLSPRTVLCVLEVGHGGMHRADDGMEWIERKPSTNDGAVAAADLPAPRKVFATHVVEQPARSRARCALGHVLTPNTDRLPGGPAFVHAVPVELEAHAGLEDAQPVPPPRELEAHGAELVDEDGQVVGMMRSPAVAAAVAAAYNAPAGA